MGSRVSLNYARWPLGQDFLVDFLFIYFLFAMVFEVYKVVFCLEVMNYDWIFFE